MLGNGGFDLEGVPAQRRGSNPLGGLSLAQIRDNDEDDTYMTP